jgi:hypothetical protein
VTKISKAIVLSALVAVAGSANAQIDTSGLQLVPADQVPATGTFWSAAHDWPPLPCPNDPNLPIYALGNGQYVYDDSQPTFGTSRTSFAASAADMPPEPPGGDGGTNAPDPWLPDSARNYAKFAALGFSVIDTNNAANNDTNLYNVIVSFSADTGTNATLQILPYRNAVVIKANHFDYSAETRDFALIVCDNVATPIMKSINLSGSSDAQDGWLVEGLVSNWKVTDPMFLMVTNITSVRDAFFKAIPYSGPQIDLAGAQPYDVVSNTLALQATITDLSGVSNDVFTISVDGAAVRYTITSNNTINIATEYNKNGPCNVNLSEASSARVYDPINPPADAKQVFITTVSLPLDFENDTFLAFASDFCSLDVGTNYILFGIDKAQSVSARIWDPSNGETLSTYTNYFPFPTTVAVPWNFTHTNGTPYTNDTYVITFIAYDPKTLNVTNTLDKMGVRTPAGCFLTYQWVDPASPDGQYQDDQMDTQIKGNLSTLYENLYKSLGLTQYYPGLIGTNRNHGGCYPSVSWTGNPWANAMWNLTNRNYSDLTLGPAHGSGSQIGGPAPYGEDQSFDLGHFGPTDLRNWASATQGEHTDTTGGYEKVLFGPATAATTLSPLVAFTIYLGWKLAASH